MSLATTRLSSQQRQGKASQMQAMDLAEACCRDKTELYFRINQYDIDELAPPLY